MGEASEMPLRCGGAQNDEKALELERAASFEARDFGVGFGLFGGLKSLAGLSGPDVRDNTGKLYRESLIQGDQRQEAAHPRRHLGLAASCHRPSGRYSKSRWRHAKGFVVSPKCSIVEPVSRGSIYVAGSPRSGRTSIARHWLSCALPQSASCSEDFVVPNEVSGRTLSI